MALCFFAVIVLSLFTGLAIGYIIFEFYVMARISLYFNYVEGDEVNNFLEEIRKSKDNGARMLNYRTDTKRTDENNHRPTRTRPVSLSSLIRENMQNASEEDEVFRNRTSLVTATTSPIESLQTNDVPEGELGEDFVPDDNLLKKYYYDNLPPEAQETVMSTSEEAIEEQSIAKTISKEGVVAESTEIITETKDNAIIATVSDTEDINHAEEIDNSQTTTGNDDFDYNFGSFDDFSTSSYASETSEYETEINEDTPKHDELSLISQEDETKSDTKNNDTKNVAIEPEKETHMSEKEKDEEKSEGKDKTDKRDKIVSNVCINIGGNASQTQNGFIGIPLTMTEKPVEPDAPPKRKRGRPPKKKK